MKKIVVTLSTIIGIIGCIACILITKDIHRKEQERRVKEDVDNHITSGTAHSTLFSSGDRIINYNDVIYVLEADGLYRFGEGKQLVYQGQLDTTKGFCTDGITAYVMSNKGCIIHIDIEAGIGEELFTDEKVLQIVGCDNDYLKETSGKPLLFLGYENDIAGGWSWGVDLCAVLPDGTVWNDIDEGVAAKMMNGILLYYGWVSDISPTNFSATSGELELKGITVWSANLNNNVLYYAELAHIEDPLSAIALHKNTGERDSVLTTVTDYGYYGIYVPGNESDVISILQGDEDEWVGDITDCRYISLDDGNDIYPQLGRGEVFVDRYTGTHYFIPYTPYVEGGTIDKVMRINNINGETTYITELPETTSQCLLINNDWLYYLTDYPDGSVQRIRLEQ